MWDIGAGQLGATHSAVEVWKERGFWWDQPVSNPGCGPFQLSELEQVMFPSRLSPHQSSVSKLFLLAPFYRWEPTLK